VTIQDITKSFAQGQAVIELGFRLENSNEITTVTGSQAIIENSVLTEQINVPAKYTHVIRAKNPDYLDKLVHSVMQTGQPFIQTRLGLVSGDSRIFLPWQEHRITFYNAIPYQDGHEIRLDTQDALFNLSLNELKVRARRGKISDIATLIAQENGLQSAVEPTKSNGGEIYIQSFMDDLEFLADRMIPRAINEKGRGSYRLFIRDNVLHFHSPDFQANVFELDYFNRSASTLVSFSDSTQLHLTEGAGGVTGIIHDPYTGNSTTVESDSQKVLNYANVTPRLSEASRSEFLCHVGANRVDEVNAMVQNLHESWYSSVYQVQLDMEKMPFLRLNDMVNVIFRPDQGRSSPWSGMFTITKVIHLLLNGTMKSTFSLQRGEQTSLGRNFQGLKSLGIPDLVIRENAAVGQPVNVAEVQASVKDNSGSQRVSSERVTGGEILKTVQAP
jgi:hypothetical protein